jgi:Co/Zn/Cd efflux system component
MVNETGADMADACGKCRAADELAHGGPEHRRALVIVIALNLGMGVAEMIGGLLGASQALKADALDFLGDGSITLLGLLALTWRPVWRARAALLQGTFLGILGVGVIAAAIYRTFVQKVPTAEVMGGVGLVALTVNVAAALVLVRHRTGDASTRAVWLFSRNDALGNVAVIVAGGVVYWTGTPWPDLVVAFGIAALFLGSSRMILGDALVELRAAGGAGAPEARSFAVHQPAPAVPILADKNDGLRVDAEERP